LIVWIAYGKVDTLVKKGHQLGLFSNSKVSDT